MRYLLLIFFLSINATVAFSQEKYPKNYFRNPLDIPMNLAGTFGELRPNHFHSGIDLKTGGASGKKIYTIAKGYVSRIRIAFGGFGKAIYVNHPNGYTSVYAHLSDYSNSIDQFIRAKQIEKKSYEIDYYLKPNELPVSENEVIALSGDTGSSGGPHLHFEIRDTKTEETINPLLFGFPVKDNIAPVINGLRAIPLSENASVNLLPLPQEISFKNNGNNTYTANPIEASGEIGLAINTVDMLNGNANKNGIYKMKVMIKNKLIFQYEMERFSFDKTKFINVHVDYKHQMKTGKLYHKLYKDDYNHLSLYPELLNNGMIFINPQDNIEAVITIEDIEGNSCKMIVPIKGNPITHNVIQPSKTTPYKIDTHQYYTLNQGDFELRIPKNTFFKDLYLNFRVNNQIATVNTFTEPLYNNYTIAYFSKSIPIELMKYAYIARKSGQSYTYVSTEKKEDKLFANTKYLGDFTVRYDSIAPRIKNANFINYPNINNLQQLSVNISDAETGIKGYDVYIDGIWTIMEYESKKSLLFCKTTKLGLSPGKHQFELRVYDQMGNINIFNTEFSSN